MEFNGDLVLGLNVLDLVIVVILFLFVLHGVARGVGRTIGGVVGLLLGGAVALWLLPHIEVTAVDRWIRLAVVGVVLLICLLGGQALGEGLLGRLTGSPPRSSRAGTAVDQAGGGVLGGAIGVVVVLAVSGFLNQVPLPWLNAQLEGSRTLAAIQRWAPQEVTDGLATAQEQVAGAPAMRELDALLFPSVQPPQTEVQDAEVVAASASTVQILGSATRCGYNQSGSGFVTSDSQVVTNAHVVQGTDSVSVFSPEGVRHAAEVVQFDPEHDLAVLEVSDLEVTPLDIAEDAQGGVEDGASAAFIGYPRSGPLSIGPATVQGSAYTVMGSVDGSQPVRVMQFAGDVQQGNSGGPLVNMDGQVIGVVFGKAVDDPAGYAVDTETLGEALTEASGATAPVDTGACQAA